VIIKPWSQKEYLESPPADDKAAAGGSMDAGMGDMDMYCKLAIEKAQGRNKSQSWRFWTL
jgi:hypothetical protein